MRKIIITIEKSPPKYVAFQPIAGEKLPKIKKETTLFKLFLRALRYLFAVLSPLARI